MKAAVLHEHGGADKFIYEDHPDPVISDSEVLVEVKACALNHVDIWMREGTGAYPVELPRVIGVDGAGVVKETGSGVAKFKAGDRVCTSVPITCGVCHACLSGDDNLCTNVSMLGVKRDGTYAQYLNIPQRCIHIIPDELSFTDAAAIPTVFLTSWHMLITRAHLQPGETVLIQAAGSGIGTAAVQIAKFLNARIIVTAGTDEKVQKALELGADEGVNYNKKDFLEEVQKLTGGDGVDVVYEHVGPAVWEKSVQALKKGGRLVTCGATTGPEVSLALRMLFARQLTLLGSFAGTKAELETMLPFFGDGTLKAVVDSVMPLKDVIKAHELMDNRNLFGKIVLEP